MGVEHFSLKLLVLELSTCSEVPSIPSEPLVPSLTKALSLQASKVGLADPIWVLVQY